MDNKLSNLSDHSTPIISFRDVSFSHGKRRILENVSFDVNERDYMAVLGPNGGGKSTLLKLMLGLLEPDSGTISIFGGEPGTAGGRIGYLPQHTHISRSFPIRVIDAVAMGLVKSGLLGALGRSKRDNEAALAALTRVDMQDYAQAPVGDLSGGQTQRVFIARALVSNPKLLLLDEPTASVDQSSRSNLYHLLGDLNESMTIIMVSHDISAVASHVKSVACVNSTVHFHESPAITETMVQQAVGVDDCCPVEVLAHGTIPHRVLGLHEDES